MNKGPTGLAHIETMHPHAADDLDIDLNALIQLFARNKAIIILTTLIGFLLALSASLVIAPRYKAQALMTLEGESAQAASLLGQANALLGNKFNSASVMAQVQIIRSRKIVGKLVDELGLLQDPAFLPKDVTIENVPSTTNPSGTTMLSIPFSRFKSFAVEGQAPAGQAPTELEILREFAITKFLKNLTVRALPGSPVISVEYTARSPYKAALYANTLTNLYIAQQNYTYQRSLETVKAWLEERMSTLSNDIQVAQKQAIIAREETGLLKGDWENMGGEAMAGLNAQLLKMQSELTELQASLEQIKAIKGDQAALQALPAINETPGFQQIKRERLALTQKLADYSRRYGPKHPEIIQINAELSALKETLDDEIANHIAKLDSDYKQKQLIIAKTQEQIARLSEENLKKLEGAVTIDAIEREIKGKTALYIQSMEALQKVKLDELQQQTLSIISYAVPNYQPISPNKRLIIILGTVLALSIGAIIAIIREKTNMTLHSPSQLEKLTGAPCYGLIPTAKTEDGEKLCDYIIKNPTSMVAEAIRTLRMTMNLQSHKPQVISLTSSLSGEGKTTLSSWISASAAKSGLRTLLIDCDLRRPNVHRFLHKANDISIVEYLSGKAELEDIIQKDPQTGLEIIYARSVPSSAIDLIASDKMCDMIETLRGAYDLIILDTPACMAVSDARTLATLSDLMLYVVSWGETPRPVLSLGIRQFKNLDVNIATVLTNVDVYRQARYGYAATVEYYTDDTPKA